LTGWPRATFGGPDERLCDDLTTVNGVEQLGTERTTVARL